jgi:DNA polymerase III alpha subunit (gram-positive type)
MNLFSDYNLISYITARDSHIVQLAAVRDGGVFSQYILPKKPMSAKASEITGITVKSNQLYHHHKRVNAVGINVVVQNFLEFLKEKDMGVTVLVGHNCKVFDLPVLPNTLKNLDMLQSFLSIVTGCIGTLPLFKMSHPDFSSYSQLHIFEAILREEYAAHDALQDVIALKRLLNDTTPSIELRAKVSCTLSSTVDIFHHKKQAKHQLATLKPLTEGEVISNGIANKIANSGLSLSHLLIAFQRNGREGIRDVFSEKLGSHVRVTKSNKNYTCCV